MRAGKVAFQYYVFNAMISDPVENNLCSNFQVDIDLNTLKTTLSWNDQVPADEALI